MLSGTFFDAGSQFVRLRDISRRIFFGGAADVQQEKVDLIYDAYESIFSGE